MTEYTAAEVRELVAGLPVLKMEAGAEASEVEALRDALEGVDQLVRELPEGERAEALVDDAQVVGRALWVPVLRNCRLSAGLSLSAEDGLSFAVKGEGAGLVEYFSAREAMRHLISGAAGVREHDVPAPEENGRNTRRAAATQDDRCARRLGRLVQGPRPGGRRDPGLRVRRRRGPRRRRLGRPRPARGRRPLPRRLPVPRGPGRDRTGRARNAGASTPTGGCASPA